MSVHMNFPPAGLAWSLSGFATGILAQIPEAVPLALVAGLAGGMCAALADWAVDGKALRFQALAQIAIGGLLAAFLYPIGQPIAESVLGSFELEPVIGVWFGGFMIGVMGLSLVVAIRDGGHAVLKRRKRDANQGENNDDV